MHGDGTPGTQGWTTCLMPLEGRCALWAQPNQIATLIWVHLDEVFCAWQPWRALVEAVHIGGWRQGTMRVLGCGHINGGTGCWREHGFTDL